MFINNLWVVNRCDYLKNLLIILLINQVSVNRRWSSSTDKKCNFPALSIAFNPSLSWAYKLDSFNVYVSLTCPSL